MTDLITRADYKTYRGITGITDDGKLDVIVPAVSALIKTYCGRTFTEFFSTNKVEKFTLKWAQQAIFLSETPIVQVVSVQEIDVGSTTYTTLDTDQYIVDERLDAIYRVETGSPVDFPVAINAVVVTYKAGYSAVPNDLALAAYDMVSYYLKEQFLPEKNHASFTIRYNADTPDFPDHIKRVLDMYKNV